jgi:hypothetical protein
VLSGLRRLHLEPAHGVDRVVDVLFDPGVNRPGVSGGNDPYGNAAIKSFWGRMQAGLLNRRRWRTRVELANAIFEYIWSFDNRRRHSALGRDVPLGFETEHRQQAATPHKSFR